MHGQRDRRRRRAGSERRDAASAAPGAAAARRRRDAARRRRGVGGAGAVAPRSRRRRRRRPGRPSDIGISTRGASPLSRCSSWHWVDCRASVGELAGCPGRGGTSPSGELLDLDARRATRRSRRRAGRTPCAPAPSTSVCGVEHAALLHLARRGDDRVLGADDAGGVVEVGDRVGVELGGGGDVLLLDRQPRRGRRVGVDPLGRLEQRPRRGGRRPWGACSRNLPFTSTAQQYSSLYGASFAWSAMLRTLPSASSRLPIGSELATASTSPRSSASPSSPAG